LNLPEQAEPVALRSKLSLRSRVVSHVLLPLALTWTLGTTGTVGVAYYFAQTAFDRAQLDDAYAMASRVKDGPLGLTVDLSTREMGAVLFDQSETVFFSVLRPDGSIIAGHPGLHAPRPQGDALIRFSEITYQGKNLRSVVLLRNEPAAFEVVVAQTMGSRTALLHNVLVYSVAPQVLLLILLAWWLRREIGRELLPLSVLQQSVNQRDAMDLTPVPVSGSSRDIERLGLAINALLARVSESLRAQREFSGNVAHELRTPLAGIRALAEYGLAQQDATVMREQLQRVALSEARASRLVEQLLALALAEEANAGVPMQAVALDEIVRESVLRFMARADAAGVDLGVQGFDHPVWVSGNAALIEGILGNLIDNALRCGRALGGQPSTVTVLLTQQAGTVTLSVLDNGAGLTLEQQRYLMQRGVRGVDSDRLGQGAGLGLAIVAKFAHVMHARFELGDVPGGPGLRATVVFNALAPTAAGAPSA
jgi:two-component system, OmpR family, sensor histidine kinase TctE